MGEVFRARDARLKRDVALKVLPAASVGDADSRSRFEREAQVLASLNHPSIAQVFGVEADGAAPVIVMEFVDGPTLADRIAKGALPLDETIALARQICDGLEAAHERGIVHRDLKPANIKVRPDGTIKILDFGLARVLTEERPADASNSPTMPGGRATTAGLILGTAAYMSPEQARGRVVDKRADIWAFGAIVYEMLTGLQAFSGESITDVLAHIVERDPDWSKLPAAARGRIEELLRRCLQKNPKDRLRDIADARYELEANGSRAALSGPRSRPSSPLTMSIAFAAGAALVAAGFLVAPMFRARPETATAMRTIITLPPDTSIALSRGSAVTVSPDGKAIAFAGNAKGRIQLYLRPLDRFESQPIAGTDGAANPFFSADGRWIGFFADEKLKKVAVDGGAPVTVIEARAPRGEDWSDNDAILLTPTNTSPVWRVSPGGGKSEKLTTLREGELSHRWPHLLPGGKALLFSIWNDSGWELARVAAASVDGTRRTVVVESDGGYPRYLRDTGTRGFLVYAREEGLLAAPFDESALSLTGQAVPVVDTVFTNLSGGAHFDLSPSGTLAYVAGTNSEADRVLAWVTLEGQATTVAQIRGLSRNWTLSRDGTRIIRMNTIGQTRDAWIDDIEHHTTMRLIAGQPNSPIWEGVFTPDGKSVIYGKGTPIQHMFRRPADGRDAEEKLLVNDRGQIPNSISPDGKTLAFVEFDPVSGADIWTMGVDPITPARVFAKTNFAESNPVFSPDGRWIVYQSNESGRFEVFVRSFPDSSQVYRVSIEGGINPKWSPSGRELIFRGLDNKMMSATVATAPTMQVGRPKALFDARTYENNFEVSPDGQRLLMMPQFTGDNTARQINLVQNFLAELRQRVR
jgi:serine/threonine-protein kinase